MIRLERDFSQWNGDSTGGSGFKGKEGRVMWDIGKELLPGRVGRHRVSREDVAAPRCAQG